MAAFSKIVKADGSQELQLAKKNGVAVLGRHSARDGFSRSSRYRPVVFFCAAWCTLCLTFLIRLVFVDESAHSVWSATPYFGWFSRPDRSLTQAGVRMLEKGGNAVDAAVAAALTLAVATPFYSGLGGGGLATVYMRGETAFLDFREVAPKRIQAEQLASSAAVAAQASRDGALSVAVPSAIIGYWTLHAKYGRLDAHGRRTSHRGGKPGFHPAPCPSIEKQPRLDWLVSSASQKQQHNF